MTENADDEAAWLRFLYHRLQAALRHAKVEETITILRELIHEVENRLETVEKTEDGRVISISGNSTQSAV